jgi:hypothetical protein
MARAPKPRGISLEELMVAQQRMIEGGNLSERQSETAQRQIEKLAEIKTALVGQEQEAVTLNNDVRRITRVKRDSRSVGLVDVRDEIRNLKDNLRGLPKLVGADKKSKEEKNKVTDEERTAILKKIGEVIGEKTALERGGARNETLTARNQATFEKFVQTTQEREKLLADADDKQREIFQELEDTLLKLREAGSEDSEKLRKELDKLSGELKATKKTAAQSNIGSRLENAQRMASGGDRGAQGTFGDALAALLGKKEVLKPGYSFDATLRGSQYRGPQGVVRPEEARAGRARGAASILGNLAAGGYERYLESRRSTRVQSFFNNFRTTESLSRVNALQGQQQELMSQLSGSSNIPNEPAGADPSALLGQRSPAEAMTRDAGKRLAANVVNITAKAVTLKGPMKPQAAPGSSLVAAATNNPLFSDAGGVKSEKEDPADRIVAAIKELTDVVREQGMGGTGIPGVDVDKRGGVSIPTLLMGATIGTVVVGGTAATMAAAGVMNTPGAEGLRKSYENPLQGAMDPDNAMGASILQAAPKDEAEYVARQKQIEEKRKNLENAPWYTRLWGIGESQYLREQQQIQGSVREVMTGQNVQSKSTINNMMREQNNQPTIITMPAQNQPASMPKVETSINMGRASVRPEENGMQRYLNRTHGSYIY